MEGCLPFFPRNRGRGCVLMGWVVAVRGDIAGTVKSRNRGKLVELCESNAISSTYISVGDYR